MARPKVNRSKLVREALDTGLVVAKEVVDYVKKTHNINVSEALVNNVKSSAKKKTGKKGKRGRKPMTVSFAKPARSMSNALSLADIVVMKGLLERLGGEGVKELADVLS